MSESPMPTVLLSEDDVARRVDQLAMRMAPHLDDQTVAVCLLTGGLWFCADLTRALSRAGRDVAFDALWLASYGDERASRGRCEVRADLQRPLVGRTALIVDDVFDSGLSLSEAARLVRDAGAGRVLTCSHANRGRPQGPASLISLRGKRRRGFSSAMAWTLPAPTVACPISGLWIEPVPAMRRDRTQRV